MRTKLDNAEQILGLEEPSWENNKIPDDIDYIHALNWYSANSDIKQAQKWFREWVKQQKFKKAEEKNILEYDISEYGTIGRTLGFICRMLSNGLPVLPESTQKKLDDLISTAKKKRPTSQVKEKETKSEKPSVQDRIVSQVNDLQSEIEVIFDDYILSVANKSKFEFNMHRWLVGKGIKPLICRKLSSEVEKSLYPDWKELVSDACDDDLKEAYSFLNKTQIKRVHDFLVKIMDDCEKTAILATKSKKKPTKTVDAKKTVSKMKFKNRDEEFDCSSIDPIKIVGAKKLWVFNSKTRKLGHYVSFDESGLSVKGTTLINYDPDKSVQKTLRKPIETLDIVQKSGPKIAESHFENVKAKASPLNGRINDETILLRVF